MLGRINGFKHFLEVVEKDKLEELVMDNPIYFYDILPYTYVLGISNKWINKFQSILYTAPEGYEGRDKFDIGNFKTFVKDVMKSANSAMSSGSSSNSSRSSGGGISGGCGGSSW